jgi:hypothetical protein
MKAIGHKTWAFADGHIPLLSHGEEPDFVSADKLCVLNTGAKDAEVEITIYFADAEPVGPFRLQVCSQRVRHVRMNDLIDPQALPLDEPYAAVIHSSVPVLVQITRRDSGQAENAIMTTMAFPADA